MLDICDRGLRSLGRPDNGSVRELLEEIGFDRQSLENNLLE